MLEELISIEQMDFLHGSFGDQVQYVGACSAEPHYGHWATLQLLCYVGDPGPAGGVLGVTEHSFRFLVFDYPVGTSGGSVVNSLGWP